MSSSRSPRGWSSETPMGIALIVGFMLAEEELIIAVFLSGVEMVLKGMRLPGEEDSTLLRKEKCAGNLQMCWPLQSENEEEQQKISRTFRFRGGRRSNELRALLFPYHMALFSSSCLSFEIRDIPDRRRKDANKTVNSTWSSCNKTY